MVKYKRYENKARKLMEHFIDFLTNKCLIVPIAAWLISQILKIIINALVHKEFRIERLWGDGGMPSGHSATVCSLAVMCGFTYGFGSGIFAIAAILATIVMNDAVGVRREAGKQAVTLKQLAELVNGAIADPDEQVRTEKLKELVGHTPLQMVFGALLGIFVALSYFWIWGFPIIA